MGETWSDPISERTAQLSVPRGRTCACLYAGAPACHSRVLSFITSLSLRHHKWSPGARASAAISHGRQCAGRQTDGQTGSQGLSLRTGGQAVGRFAMKQVSGHRTQVLLLGEQAWSGWEPGDSRGAESCLADKRFLPFHPRCYASVSLLPLSPTHPVNHLSSTQLHTEERTRKETTLSFWKLPLAFGVHGPRDGSQLRRERRSLVTDPRPSSLPHCLHSFLAAPPGH